LASRWPAGPSGPPSAEASAADPRARPRRCPGR
jgi:hypothetical protein